MNEKSEILDWTGPGSAKNWDLKIVRDIKIRMSEIIGNDREYEK